MFYLNDGGARERIEATINSTTQQKQYATAAAEKIFTEETIVEELEQHPERFSANVILRGVFQEMVLPNVAFIGGGGELAYWLELKALFEALQVPYPVLVLRNSFLLLEKKPFQLVQKLQLTPEQLFLTHEKQIELLVTKNTDHRLKLEDEGKAITDLYSSIQQTASAIDPSLQAHVAAQHAYALKHCINWKPKC